MMPAARCIGPLSLTTKKVHSLYRAVSSTKFRRLNIGNMHVHVYVFMDKELNIFTVETMIYRQEIKMMLAIPSTNMADENSFLNKQVF